MITANASTTADDLGVSASGNAAIERALDNNASVVAAVVPMEITFMDTEDEYYKYGTLSPLRYIHSNPFRFPISSLGLPNIPSQEG